MAVTAFEPMDIRGSATGNSVNRVATGYGITYRAKIDDAIPDPKVVLDYCKSNGVWPGKPFKPSGGYKGDPNAYCRSVRPQFVKDSSNPFMFYVDVEFESILPQRDEIQEYSTQFSVAQEAAVFYGAINANKLSPFLKVGKLLPVTNSAGKVHDPQMEEEFEVKVIRITKTLLKFNGTDLERFRGCINTDDVIIDRSDVGFTDAFGPYFGRLRIVGADLFYDENDIPRWRQTTEIWVNPFGWRRNILDQGTSTTEWPGEGSTSFQDSPAETRIKDADGYPVTQPVLLNGNGKELDTARESSVYLVWGTKPETAFMPLRGIAW